MIFALRIKVKNEKSYIIFDFCPDCISDCVSVHIHAEAVDRRRSFYGNGQKFRLSRSMGHSDQSRKFYSDECAPGFSWISGDTSGSLKPENFWHRHLAGSSAHACVYVFIGGRILSFCEKEIRFL